MKSNIIAVTQAWRSLSSTQRTNFIAFAAAYPQYDKKTGTSKLGGYEVFLLWNLNRLSRGKALSINITSVPILQSVINPQLFRYGALLYFRPECGSEYGFCEYSIFMSRLLSAGKVNPGSHMRFVDTYLEDVSTVDITATYVNLLGAIPVVGDHGVVWSRAIGILSPFLFATQKFNLIVGAL